VQLPSGLCSANDITHEQRIAGCTASIESGTLTGWPLKVAYCNRGYALTELGEYDRVITDSDALIAINPQAGCGYLNRARAWYYKHDLGRAIADYTRAITSEPRLHEAYASRGTAYFDRREFGKAIADYDAAISIDSDIPMYFSDRGNTRYMMGDYRSAIADYNRAVEIDPDYWQAYARRGWAFLCLDELANAEADFDKALKLAPGDAYAQSGRAEVQSTAEQARSRGAIHRGQLRQSPPHGGATERSRGEEGMDVRLGLRGLLTPMISAAVVPPANRYSPSGMDQSRLSR
jgi:tetratricopeptide (TPR) repeat protein